MNGVDVADQLRSYYNTQTVHFKTWKPLWHFLLDTAVVNAFIIYASNPKQPWGPYRKNHLHRQIRRELVIGLFDHSEYVSMSRSITKPLAEYVHRATPKDHGELVRLEDTPQNCKAYLVAGRKTPGRWPKRKALEDLSVNTVQVVRKQRKRPEKTPRTRFGCQRCDIYLCAVRRCWNEHIEAIY